MKNYTVYWIHSVEHTNYFQEGYVGITCDFSNRMSRHKRDNRNPILRNAINKHKWDNLQKTILLKKCTKKEAINLEINLRPTREIGWNIEKGGGLPPEITDEKRLQISLQHKGKKLSDKHKEILLNVHRGSIRSEEVKEKLKQSKLGKLNPMFKLAKTIQCTLPDNSIISLKGKTEILNAGFSPSSVYRALKENNSYKGCYFKVINDARC